jgi:hypothetical protein
LPGDYRDLKCDYYTRVVIAEGTQQKIIELTRLNPNDEGIVSTVDPNSCTVTVDVPDPSTLSRPARRVS